MLAALGLFLAPLPDADAFGPAKTAVQQTAETRLIAQFQRFASLTDGTVGIVVRDLGTGETLSLNGDTLFPMASAYKVAVAGRIFAMVDAGALTLEDQLASPAGPVSVATLLDLMLTRSDNDATDLLVARAGGPTAVHQWVAGLGIRGLRVDSNTADLLYRAMGLAPSRAISTAMSPLRWRPTRRCANAMHMTFPTSPSPATRAIPPRRPR